MKKPILFISDFDGTMTFKDFYLQFTETHLKELDALLFDQFRKREITSFEYLARILAELDLSESEIEDRISSFPADPSVKPVFDLIRSLGGECAVVSAGAELYIRPIMDRMGLESVPLYANRGTLKNRGIVMEPPLKRSQYSYQYGIDKESVVRELAEDFDTVIYAGDGSADLHAARSADIRFAKSVLASKLRQESTEFIPFETFETIHRELLKRFL